MPIDNKNLPNGENFTTPKKETKRTKLTQKFRTPKNFYFKFIPDILDLKCKENMIPNAD